MIRDVVGEPGRQVLGGALIGDEIGAGQLAGRRAEGRVRHRIASHQHRLLRQRHVAAQRSEPLQMAVGGQRCFQVRDVVEVELQAKLRRRTIVQIRIVRAATA